MQIVEAPLQFQPHQCAITGRSDGRIVDFGTTMPGIDPHLYLKTEVVEEAAKLLGMVPRERAAELATRLEALEAQLQDVIEQNDSLLKAVGVIDQIREGAPA